MDEGHCGLPEDDLLRIGAELLEVSADRLTAALALELEDGAVVADTVGERRCIFLTGLYRAEQESARRLRELAAGEPPGPEIDVDRAIPWLEARGAITLSASQREAPAGPDPRRRARRIIRRRSRRGTRTMTTVGSRSPFPAPLRALTDR